MFTHVFLALFAAAHTSSRPMTSPEVTSATRGDSVVTTLLNRDSTSRLTLTGRSLAFEFTRAGVDRARERADSSLADRHTAYPYGETWLASIVRSSVAGALRGIHIQFRLDDIEHATVNGATIVFTFKPSAHDSNSDNTFDFEAVDAATAARFAERVNALLRDRR